MDPKTSIVRKNIVRHIISHNKNWNEKMFQDYSLSELMSFVHPEDRAPFWKQLDEEEAGKLKKRY